MGFPVQGPELLFLMLKLRPEIGLAIGIDMKTSVDWVPERTSYLCNGMLKAGSVVRDNGGLVKVEYKDNV